MEEKKKSRSNAAFGTVIGAPFGTYIGYSSGSHIGIAVGQPIGAISGKWPCAIVCGIIGGLIGNVIGTELDRTYDLKCANRSSQNFNWNYPYLIDDYLL